MISPLKIRLLLLVLSIATYSNTWAQSRESWVPDPWPDPTSSPQPGTDRVILYRPDSARTALLVLAAHLTQQGFVVQQVTKRHVMAGCPLPDSLRFKGGARMNLLVTTVQAFPAILLMHGTGVPNLRRLKRLSGTSTSHPNGHKVKYPGEDGKNGGMPTSLSQVVFDRMIALIRSYPTYRVMYLNL